MSETAESLGGFRAARRQDMHQPEFELLFSEHYERVVRLIIRWTGDRPRAEELANEVFWRLSQQPARWLLTGNVAPWLYRAAMNAGIDAYRAALKRAQYERGATAGMANHVASETALDTLLREESRLRVQKVLSAMKPARAQLLLMRAGGASYRELAETLGVGITSIGTLLIRAEEDFRKRYMTALAKEKRK